MAIILCKFSKKNLSDSLLLNEILLLLLLLYLHLHDGSPFHLLSIFELLSLLKLLAAARFSFMLFSVELVSKQLHLLCLLVLHFSRCNNLQLGPLLLFLHLCLFICMSLFSCSLVCSILCNLMIFFELCLLQSLLALCLLNFKV